MALVCSHKLRMRRSCHHAAPATAEARTINSHIVHNRAVVDVCDVGVPHVVDGPVVAKLAAAPVAALIADATVAIAVIDTAVKADVRAPVAGMPHEGSAAPAPVARRPQVSGDGRERPGTRHPVIVAAVPAPVARDPQVPRARHGRLLIHRQRRRCEIHRQSELDSCVRRDRKRRKGRESQCGDQTANDVAHTCVLLGSHVERRPLNGP